MKHPLATIARVTCAARLGSPANGLAILLPAALPLLPQGGQASLQSSLEDWRAKHGQTWTLDVDPETAFASSLYGGAVTAPAQAPKTDADFLLLGRQLAEQSAAMHGLDPATLFDDRVVFLPLANAGSTDKVTVRYRQELNGVAVLHGFLNALFDLQGRLLSVDATGAPNLTAFSTQPAVPAAQAPVLASAWFTVDTGSSPTHMSEPGLVILQVVKDQERVPVLAWEIELRREELGAAPLVHVYYIDAKDGSLAHRKNAVHNFDVSGTVQSYVTPADRPDKTGNPPPVVQPMANLTVTWDQGGSSGFATTDANGSFTIPGRNPPIDVTVRYEGPWSVIDGTVIPQFYSLTVTLNSSQGNVVTMNDPPSVPSTITSRANAFKWLNLTHDWIKFINPTDPTPDFLAGAQVNVNFASIGKCNAVYDKPDPGSVLGLFFSKADTDPQLPSKFTCPNLAYSTVVVHEYGHWLDDRYNSPVIAGSGFSEGLADTFAMYVNDSAAIFREFRTAIPPNPPLPDPWRTGLNTRRFCGTAVALKDCYQGQHDDGEVLMGALWKVRSRLKATLGDIPGALAADTLFNGWVNAYDDTEINVLIMRHWLTLDDDDGNLANGTPHYADIEQGFLDNDFPPMSPRGITFSNVTTFEVTSNELGPYAIDADIAATFRPPILSATLHYRVNGGAFGQVAMTPSGPPGHFTGLIPGQESPAKVEYFLRATDSSQQTIEHPAVGPLQKYLRFFVGTKQVVFFDDFEAGAGSWTHGGTPPTDDDWMLGTPAGKSGVDSFGLAWADPAAAYSGTMAWGTDLGTGGDDGKYSSLDFQSFLLSPSLNVNPQQGVYLRFKRWLTVARGGSATERDFQPPPPPPKVLAEITANGSRIWANHSAIPHIDGSWTTEEIDVRQVVGPAPSVQLRWRLDTESIGDGISLGGWNLDDVEVFSILAVP